MKAIVCTAFGPVESLQYLDVPDPVAGPGQLLIRIEAASINFADSLGVQGLYQVKPALPFIPGTEIAGTIESVGEGISHLQSGQRVVAFCMIGGFAEKVAINAQMAIPLPDGMKCSEAAGLLTAHATAHHALRQRSNLQAGETLLVTGAAGGTGLAAVQIGKAIGARVIAVCSSDEKLALAKANGADILIKHSEGDLTALLKEATGGKGVDVAYETVGGASFDACVRNMAWNGRLLVVGFAGGEIPKFPVNLALVKGFSVVGVYLGPFTTLQTSAFIANMRELMQWYMQGKVRVVVDEVFPLERTVQAIRKVTERKVMGKAIVSPDPAALMRSDADATLAAQQFHGRDGMPSVIAGLQERIGEEIGVSDWVELSQERIGQFAGATGDHQWIHVDVARSVKESPFGGTIAHGFLSLSTLAAGANEILVGSLGIKQAYNYGLDKVRFLIPVMAGQRVRSRFTLTGVEPKGNGRYLLSAKCRVEIEGSDKPAVLATALVMLVI